MCQIHHAVTVRQVAITVSAPVHMLEVHGQGNLLLGIRHVQTCGLVGETVGTVEQGSHQRHWSGGNPCAVADLCGGAVLV